VVFRFIDRHDQGARCLTTGRPQSAEVETNAYQATGARFGAHYTSGFTARERTQIARPWAAFRRRTLLRTPS